VNEHGVRNDNVAQYASRFSVARIELQAYRALNACLPCYNSDTGPELAAMPRGEFHLAISETNSCRNDRIGVVTVMN
jgi:hypothetical protein